MKNSNLLITTAMLTAIFETSKKDTIELIIPFVLNIIASKKGSIIVNEVYIKEQLNEKYSFNNFPNAILRIILNRLKRSKKIILNDNEYTISDDNVYEGVESFNNRMNVAKQESEQVIQDLLNYLREKIKNNLTVKEVESYFALFLKRNGYSIFSDIDSIRRKDIKNDQVNYYIAQYILHNYENNTSVFEKIKRITEGFMLATAMYVQVESDNNAKFDKLVCYFDAPFLLRILEYKTFYMNESANELKKLLEDNGAKIKCFSHNYLEVEGILENYIKNYGKQKEKTLEGLDFGDYSLTELQMMLDNLGERFRELKIEIVDTPEYDKNKYSSVIDETKLSTMLKTNYTNVVPQATIDNDVRSVAAIMRIRENKNYRKMEDAKAIFVTTNYEIRACINELLNVDQKYQISPAISDVDMTAIVWLKSFKINNELSTIKLIENARAALEPSMTIIKKFNDCVERLQNDTKISTDEQSLGSMLTSMYYRKKLMENIDGTDKNLNEKVVIDTYNQTLEENKIVKETNNKLAERNNDLINKLLEKEKKDKSDAEQKNNFYRVKSRKKAKLIILVLKIILVVLWLGLVYGVYATIISSETIETNEVLKKIITWIYAVVSLMSTIFPIIKIGFKHLNKKYDYIKEFFIKRYEKKAIEYKIIN